MRNVLGPILIAGGMVSFPSSIGAQMLAEQQPAPAMQSGQADQGEGGAATGEIIVTAQRRTERLRDVPLTISAQSAADLARQGVDDMKDLAVAVPGLSFTSQGVVANPSIRGVSTQLSGPGAESPIAIYVDGVYQPNQASNLFELPDINRVEVLKGPQGTLFGRNATGGAISIYTRDPTFKPSADITLTAGLYTGGSARSSSNLKASAYVSVPIIDDVLAASFSGFYNHVDGYLTNDANGRRTGGIKNRLARAKILFTPAEGVRFLLSGFYGKTEDDSSSLFPLNGVTVGSQYPGAVIPTQPWHVAGEQANGGSYYKSTQKAVNLRSEFELGELGDLTSITSYARVLPKFAVDIDASLSPNCLAIPFACITPFLVIQGPDKTLQQEFSFSTKRFGAFSAVLGAYYYKNTANYGYNISPPISPTVSWEDSPPGLVTVASRVKTTAYALFGEINFVASDDLKFIGGLRYSWEKKKGDGAFSGGAFARFDAQKANALTPRLSVLYTVNSAVNVYATYSKGFKSGILDGAGLTNTGSDPEKLTSYEAGVKVGSGRFKLNTAAFYYDYKGLQTQFFDGVAPIYGNAADAKLYGFDVDSSIPLGSALDLRVAAAWTPYAKYKNYPSGVAFQFPLGPFGLQQVEVNPSGDRMLKNPKLTASATLNYSTELSGAKLDLSGTVYHSSSYRWELLGRVNTPNYTIFNAQIAITPRDSDFRISLWGKNLSNKAYFTGTVLSAGADAVVYSPPREIGISANYSF